MQVTTIGLDIAKNVFQVHGVDAHGRVVLRRRLSRSQGAGVLRQPAALPGRPRGRRRGASLGARADPGWATTRG